MDDVNEIRAASHLMVATERVMWASSGKSGQIRWIARSGSARSRRTSSRICSSPRVAKTYCGVISLLLLWRPAGQRVEPRAFGPSTILRARRTTCWIRRGRTLRGTSRRASSRSIVAARRSAMPAE